LASLGVNIGSTAGDDRAGFIATKGFSSMSDYERTGPYTPPNVLRRLRANLVSRAQGAPREPLSGQAVDLLTGPERSQSARYPLLLPRLLYSTRFPAPSCLVHSVDGSKGFKSGRGSILGSHGRCFATDPPKRPSRHVSDMGRTFESGPDYLSTNDEYWRDLSDSSICRL
jgi:hypothetical protein